MWQVRGRNKPAHAGTPRASGGSNARSEQILFWIICVLTWVSLPFLIGAVGELLDDWKLWMANPYVALIMLVTFGPVMLGIIIAGLSLLIGALVLACRQPKWKFLHVLAVPAGVGVALLLSGTIPSSTAKHQNKPFTDVVWGKLGNFQLTLATQEDRVPVLPLFSPGDAYLDNFEPSADQMHRWRLSWRDQTISLCAPDEPSCRLYRLTAVADTKPTLIAVLTMGSDAGERARVLRLEDKEDRYTVEELAVLDAKLMVYIVDQNYVIAEALRSEKMVDLGGGLWLNPQAMAILPANGLRILGIDRRVDSEMPLMLSPDRRWVAFLYTDGLIQVADVAKKQAFHACYLLPLSPETIKDYDPYSLPRPDWKRFLSWTKAGLAIAPAGHAKTLLEPPAQSSAQTTVEARKDACQPPDS